MLLALLMQVRTVGDDNANNFSAIILQREPFISVFDRCPDRSGIAFQFLHSGTWWQEKSIDAMGLIEPLIRSFLREVTVCIAGFPDNKGGVGVMNSGSIALVYLFVFNCAVSVFVFDT